MNTPVKKRARGPERKVIAFLDIGTNSIRMMIVAIHPGRAYKILRKEKEVVRLGESEFDDGLLRPAAMDRSVLVCRRFVEVAKAFGAGSIIAVATSATRDAKNRAEFLGRLKDEAHLDVTVISGGEEARLIYLGVASGQDMGRRKALFIDIGGGSTEIAYGSRFRYDYVDSFDLGAIRLTTLFIGVDCPLPVPQEIYDDMKAHVRSNMQRAVNALSGKRVRSAYGSSGTIMNLAAMAVGTSAVERTVQKSDRKTLEYGELVRLSGILRSLPLADRKKYQGINPGRADIIVAGAAILETLMEEFCITELKISDRGLLDGLVIDRLSRFEGFPHLMEMPVRERSILHLARSCGINEEHAKQVRRISLQLFDSAGELGMHELAGDERELLSYAAVLHDIGNFIAFKNHHDHTHYLISNTEILGFNQREIDVIAEVARFHRKKPPRVRYLSAGGMDEMARETVVILSALLRLAESLDRSHGQIVDKARFVAADERSAELSIWSGGDCELELWGVESNAKAFEKAFKRKLSVHVITE